MAALIERCGKFVELCQGVNVDGEGSELQIHPSSLRSNILFKRFGVAAHECVTLTEPPHGVMEQSSIQSSLAVFTILQAKKRTDGSLWLLPKVHIVKDVGCGFVDEWFYCCWRKRMLCSISRGVLVLTASKIS